MEYQLSVADLCQMTQQPLDYCHGVIHWRDSCWVKVQQLQLQLLDQGQGEMRLLGCLHLLEGLKLVLQLADS